MNIEEFRDFCLSLKGVTEHLPFDDRTLVFKVMNKMFALADIEQFERINVKCEPALAEELREKYASVQAGYHMSKKHWNTILIGGELNDQELQHWILHSYQLIVAGLPQKVKQELENI
jgi:predicted DNA-binding protein (MmcQ/YjbR family)